MEPDKRAQECGKHELWQWRLRLAMSRGRHQTCGYLMAVDDTCIYHLHVLVDCAL